MKKLLLITIYILSVTALQSQERYFVTASSGLIIREAPNINSTRIGKLPYGSTVELLETTEIKLQIIDNGEPIDGFWVKMKFNNSPFIVSESKKDLGYDREGYVFSEFLEKLNKASIKTIEIDSVKFQSLYIPTKSSNMIKIISEKETKKLLKGKVKWKDVENIGCVIDEITLDNGQILKINQKSNDYNFIAYYPKEEIIIFEGGHASEFSISIKTGESLETTGVPDYIVESPNKKIRLNGWFSGQECSVYFFQKKVGNRYMYLADFERGNENYGSDLCYFNKFCWLNDQEFMYSSTENGEQKYYIGEIAK